jgi:hypothetical protein
MTPGGIRTRDLSFHRRCNSDLHHGPWVESWRGTSDAVAALASVRASNPLGAVAPCRSNRHLHHRLADATHRQSLEHAGEQAISVSVTATQLRSLWKRTAPGRVQALARPHPGACVKDGNRTRFFHGAKYPKSSPPASVQPREAANRIENKFHSRRFDGAATANPLGFALPSVSGSAPRSLRQAPRFWARACRREPRDPGLPFRLAPGCFDEPASDNKKPSGAAGSGGSE